MNTSFAHDFATTHSSLVFNAANSQSPRHERALNELCRRYWFPLYAYARNCGNADADAKDLVQGFFVSQVLQTNFLEGWNSKKGRFRDFLRKCFKNYSLNEWRRACCQKRGGGADSLPLDWVTADKKYQSQLMAPDTPERAYDRAWAVTLLEHVLSQLRQEMEADGKRELFKELRPSLMFDREDFSYQEAAKRLNTNEAALRKAAQRLRERYRELIREEIRKTCAPEAIEEEIRFLRNVLS